MASVIFCAAVITYSMVNEVAAIFPALFERISAVWAAYRVSVINRGSGSFYENKTQYIMCLYQLIDRHPLRQLIALQLQFLMISESIGNHDSEPDDWWRID
jgi:hypothetical protein